MENNETLNRLLLTIKQDDISHVMLVKCIDLLYSMVDSDTFVKLVVGLK